MAGIITKIIKIVVEIIASIAVLFSGCTESVPHKEATKMIVTIEKDIYKDVFECVKNKDKESLRAMFSEQAIKDCEDIDKQIDDFFDFFEGELLGCQSSNGEIQHYENSGEKMRHSVDVSSEFHTMEGYYLVSICYYDRDRKNPLNLGVYTITVRKGGEEHTMSMQ